MADYQLIYNCPGCGKESQAPEDALTNCCEYCGLIVRIGMPGRVLKYFYPSRIDPYGARMAADRYLKDCGLPLTGQIDASDFYYLPFYRFRGIALDYITPPDQALVITEQDDSDIPSNKSRLKAKNFDVTIPAADCKTFGMFSLGIRPQAVPLYGFSREQLPAGAIVVGSTITPGQAESQALDLRDHNVLLYNKAKSSISAMIGEKISVIYFPIWAICYQSGAIVKTVFVDALAKRGYAHIEGEFLYDGKISTGENSQYVKPVRHQCPNCGADLPADRFSLFYPCKNCHRTFILNDNGYSQTEILSAESSSYAPYWRFPLEFSDSMVYKTVADFAKVLNGEIALLHKEKRANQFYLYSPAFKSADVYNWYEHAYSFLRTQSYYPLTDKMPQNRVAFSIEEAEAKQMALFLWRVLTAKYSSRMPGIFNIAENNIPDGQIVWLPASDDKLFTKTLNF